MALAPCPHCRHNVNTSHQICPYCGQSMAPASVVLAGKFLTAAECVGGFAYFIGLTWLALDPARPLAAVLAAALGGAAFLACRLFRR